AQGASLLPSRGGERARAARPRETTLGYAEIGLSANGFDFRRTLCAQRCSAMARPPAWGSARLGSSLTPRTEHEPSQLPRFRNLTGLENSAQLHLEFARPAGSGGTCGGTGLFSSPIWVAWIVAGGG